MNTCIFKLQNSQRCTKKLNKKTSLCDKHWQVCGRFYDKYKTIDRESEKYYNNIRKGNPSVYELMKAHEKLYQSYKLRSEFREKFVHISAYDNGHDMRIKNIWNLIEECTIKLKNCFNDAMNIDVEEDNSTKENNIENVKKYDISSNIKKIKKIRKREKDWSEFIPLVLSEKLRIKNEVKSDIEKIKKLYKEKFNLDSLVARDIMLAHFLYCLFSVLLAKQIKDMLRLGKDYVVSLKSYNVLLGSESVKEMYYAGNYKLLETLPVWYGILEYAIEFNKINHKNRYRINLCRIGCNIIRTNIILENHNYPLNIEVTSTSKTDLYGCLIYSDKQSILAYNDYRSREKKEFNCERCGKFIEIYNKSTIEQGDRNVLCEFPTETSNCEIELKKNKRTTEENKET